jgi:UDP-glucuronate 4-epimerase
MGALFREHGYEIYNIGESQTTSLSELVQLIEEQMGKRAQVEYLPAQPGDVERTYADIRKARERLGYQPKVNMREGISRFVRWYLEEGSM